METILTAAECAGGVKIIVEGEIRRFCTIFPHRDMVSLPPPVRSDAAPERLPKCRTEEPPPPADAAPETNAGDDSGIVFPTGPDDDPLAVLINGQPEVFGKVQYRLFRWLYWYWKHEGRTVFEFAEVGESVWGDDLTERDTIEAAVKKIKAALERAESRVFVRYEKEKIYVGEK